ncbi:hypothetical protein AK812_SmicGene6807 [Symbiodinium microadriaticum]|uniref:Uncharacterized protein n=1 Tax=Symbiodinium microadriaticum TaxID=2951 RepID=A0A1Q9EQC2_SYMMI|nr:hypothetical protein AK812_SmicGene6807 [Symbiodinium microadriaticum]
MCTCNEKFADFAGKQASETTQSNYSGQEKTTPKTDQGIAPGPQPVMSPDEILVALSHVPSCCGVTDRVKCFVSRLAELLAALIHVDLTEEEQVTRQRLLCLSDVVPSDGNPVKGVKAEETLFPSHW